MDAQTARTIQYHGLGDRNGEEFAREGPGWVEQLPCVRRKGRENLSLSEVQHTKFLPGLGGTEIPPT